MIKRNAGAMTVECTGYVKHCEGVADVVGGRPTSFLVELSPELNFERQSRCF